MNKKGRYKLFYKLMKKSNIIFFILIILWIIYFISAYKLFSEINTFTTPGSSYIIKLLEFTNYRASNLSAVVIEYFILISITITIYMYAYLKLNDIEKKTKIALAAISSIILFILIIFFTNIFWPVYLILTLLSLLIIIASFFVANTIWGKKVTFEKGDTIFQSSFFDSKQSAEIDYKKLLQKLEANFKDQINGEVFLEDGKYYFEIYALNKITIDSSKGDLDTYEII